MEQFNWPQQILILIPFMVGVIVGLGMFVQKQTEINQKIQALEDAQTPLYEKQLKKDQPKGLFAKQNQQFQRYGVNETVEKLILKCGLAFIAGCAGSILVFKAGITLTIYLGGLCALIVWNSAKGKTEKAKQKLTVEYLQKMRDVTMFLSVGKNFDNALYEAMTEGMISDVLLREFEMVRQDIYINHKYSKAFERMYQRLDIKQIKTDADTFAVFEETGGNLIPILKANDKAAMSELAIQKEQEVFISSQKTQQKFVIGLPFALIVGMFLINPSFFGGFYGTVMGQVIAIVCVSILTAGVYLANQAAKIEI